MTDAFIILIYIASKMSTRQENTWVLESNKQTAVLCWERDSRAPMYYRCTRHHTLMYQERHFQIWISKKGREGSDWKWKYRQPETGFYLRCILLLFHKTVQCRLHAPFLTFPLFCSITHCSLHVSTAHYQHNAHSFNKQHHSPSYGLRMNYFSDIIQGP